MRRLAILDQPRIFPPKKFLLAVWAVTLAIAVYGLVNTPTPGAALVVWGIIAAVAFWQIWTFRWVQVDNEGIRMRNVFQRGRELKWDEITEFHEEEVRLSKHPYVVLHLSNKNDNSPNPTRIKVTSDQIEFETLRTIVREAVPKS